MKEMNYDEKNSVYEDESKIMIKKYLLLGGTFSVLICELR